MGLMMLHCFRWRDVKLRAFEDADHRTYVDLKVSHHLLTLLVLAWKTQKCSFGFRSFLSVALYTSSCKCVTNIVIDRGLEQLGLISFLLVFVG